jgi:hypothetical protein
MEVALPGTEHVEPRLGWSSLRGGVFKGAEGVGSFRPLLGPNLLLLLDRGPDFLGCFRSANHLIGCFVAICFAVLRQPQPDLRHLE